MFDFLEKEKTPIAYLNVSEQDPELKRDFPKFTKNVIEKVLPRILFKRFSGIFLYNITPLLNKNEIYVLIKSIHYHYPSIKIMVPLDIEGIEDFASDIDLVFVPMLFTNSSSDLLSDNQVKKRLFEIESLRKINPKLTVCAIDYWKGSDPDTQKILQKKAQEHEIVLYLVSEKHSIPFLIQKDHS